MAGPDDEESDEDLRKELSAARDDLRRQLAVLSAGPALGRDQTPDFDEMRASLTEELRQVETELAKYPSEPTVPQDGEADPTAPDPLPAPDAESEPDPDPEAEDTSDPEPIAPAPIQFHTDAPDSPPDNSQFWTFAGMGVVALLALGLLLQIFSMLWAHLMGHPAG
jgi:hypothetical protein